MDFDQTNSDHLNRVLVADIKTV